MFLCLHYRYIRWEHRKNQLEEFKIFPTKFFWRRFGNRFRKGKEKNKGSRWAHWERFGFNAEFNEMWIWIRTSWLRIRFNVMLRLDLVLNKLKSFSEFHTNCESEFLSFLMLDLVGGKSVGIYLFHSLS